MSNLISRMGGVFISPMTRLYHPSPPPPPRPSPPPPPPVHLPRPPPPPRLPLPYPVLYSSHSPFLSLLSPPVLTSPHRHSRRRRRSTAPSPVILPPFPLALPSLHHPLSPYIRPFPSHMSSQEDRRPVYVCANTEYGRRARQSVDTIIPSYCHRSTNGDMYRNNKLGIPLNVEPINE